MNITRLRTLSGLKQPVIKNSIATEEIKSSSSIETLKNLGFEARNGKMFLQGQEAIKASVEFKLKKAGFTKQLSMGGVTKYKGPDGLNFQLDNTTVPNQEVIMKPLDEEIEDENEYVSMYHKFKNNVEETAGVGRVTGFGLTADVKSNSLKKNAAKFGFKVNKDGVPPRISKKTNT